MKGYECIYDRQKQSAKFYVDLKNVSRLSMCESVSQKIIDGQNKKAAPRCRKLGNPIYRQELTKEVVQSRYNRIKKH